MNKINKSLIGLLLLGSLTSLQARQAHWFDFDFGEIEEHFEKQMKHMHKSMKRLSKLPKNELNASIKEEDKNVMVTISGIDAQELDATLNDSNDQLSIITPDHRITIAVKGNVIGIETSQEKKEVKETTKKDDKEQQSARYISSSYTSMSQMVSENLLLEKQTIDYDQDNKRLIITIPKQEAKKGKPIPVNRINKSKIADPESKTIPDKEK